MSTNQTPQPQPAQQPQPQSMPGMMYPGMMPMMPMQPMQPMPGMMPMPQAMPQMITGGTVMIPLKLQTPMWSVRVYREFEVPQGMPIDQFIYNLLAQGYPVDVYTPRNGGQQQGYGGGYQNNYGGYGGHGGYRGRGGRY